MDKFTIINAIPSKDRLTILNLYNNSFPLSTWNKKYWNSFFKNSLRQPVFFAIKINNQYAGFVLGRVGKDTSIMLLSTLVVSPTYRGNRYGSILIQKFLETTFSFPNIHKVILHFRDFNAWRLEPYYAHLDFINHKIEGTYSNGEKKHCVEIHKKDFLN